MERDKTLDVLKGIAIILMVAGHCPCIWKHAHEVIYSFHMPLFFLVTGYLYKQKEWKVRMKSDTRMLLLPYFIFAIAIVLISHNSLTELRKYSLAILLADGAWQPTTIFSYKTSIGCLWFLPAMFWARQFFNFILRSRFWFPLSLITGVAGYYLQMQINLPLAFNEGLVASAYLAIGYYFAHNKVSKIWIVFCLLCWVVLSWQENFDIGCYKYENFPLCITSALGGSLVCYYISRYIKDMKIGSFLSICGRYTLSILCLHALAGSLAGIFLSDRYEVYTLRMVINIVLVVLWIIYKERRVSPTLTSRIF